MTRPLSPRDYETLSAYLDGELSPKDQARIETRIHASPEWQAGLDELRYTHVILSRTPLRRAPRNFTLKPSMVRGRVVSPAYPIFRLASALASILLILAFASDLFLSSGMGIIRTQSPVSDVAPQAQKSAGAAPTEPASLEQTQPGLPNPESTDTSIQPFASVPFNPQTTQAATPTQEFGIGGGCDTAACPTTTPAPYSIAGGPVNAEGTPIGLGAGGGPSPDETEQASAAMTNAPLGMGGPEPINPTNTPVPDATVITEPPQPSGLAASNRAASTSPTDTQEAAPPLLSQGPNPNTPAAYPTSPSTPFDEHGLFRLLEITLAATAVVTGTVAVILRMRANS
jgi:hypothetical protein